MFVNLSEGFEDGVREEVLAHLNVVIPNIQIIKNQVTHFGDGINDILTQMTHLDDNVMVNNVPINKMLQSKHQNHLQNLRIYY